MSKINLNHTMQDVIAEMSEGNPGALTVMLKLIENARAVDPDSRLGSWSPLFTLDTLEIYGPGIWILYKDVCGQNILYLLALLRASGLGIVPPNNIKAMAREDFPRMEGKIKFNLEEILGLVMKELPNFNRKKEAA